MNFINIYYNYLAFQNNIILNILLIINIFLPKQINNHLIYYKKKRDDYYKYLLILSINNKIEKKYNINILNIGLNIYDKYKKYINNDIEEFSDIDELSDIEEDYE